MSGARRVSTAGVPVPGTAQGRGENARDSFPGSGNTKAHDEVQILGAPSVTDSPAAPDRSLKAQPAKEDIANALQILLGTRDGYAKTRDPVALIDAFAAVNRLLRGALAKLDGASGPPNKQDQT